MMWSLTTLARFVLVVGVALPHVVFGAPTNDKRAIIPQADPFYTPPSGYASTAPGTILRQRQVVSSFFGLIPEPVTTWQLLYRTTAIDGSAIAEVTTIFVPPNAATDRFVSFQTAYDSSASICDPSYNYQLGAAQVDLISDVEALLLEAYLISGYIVSSSDYEGPDAAFGAGRLSGMGTLDNMRAVVNFRSTLGLTTSKPQIVGVGYSGGAIATGWAASLQPTYAPELNIKGWASGGTPANLTGTAVFVDNTLFSGFLPAAIVGLEQPTAYGATLAPLVNSIVTARGRSILSLAKISCAPADILSFLHQSIFSTSFQTLGRNLFYNPVIVPILQANTMGVKKSETPIAPVRMYHAAPDEIIPYADAQTLRQRWCNYGASVHFTTFASGGHFTTEILGFVDQFQFVQAAFAGVATSGCTQDTVLSNTLDPLALGADLEPVLVQLANTLLDLGDQDSNVISDPSVLKK